MQKALAAKPDPRLPHFFAHTRDLLAHTRDLTHELVTQLTAHIPGLHPDFRARARDLAVSAHPLENPLEDAGQHDATADDRYEYDGKSDDHAQPPSLKVPVAGYLRHAAHGAERDAEPSTPINVCPPPSRFQVRLDTGPYAALLR